MYLELVSLKGYPGSLPIGHETKIQYLGIIKQFKFPNVKKIILSPFFSSAYVIQSLILLRLFVIFKCYFCYSKFNRLKEAPYYWKEFDQSKT